MVSQVMNAFCQLPGSQALLLSQASNQSASSPSLHLTPNTTAVLEQLQKGGAVSAVGQTESLSSLTSSIAALTTNITSTKKDSDGFSNTSGVVCSAAQQTVGAVTVSGRVDEEMLNNGINNGISHDFADLNSTAQDVSTLSHDGSTLPHDDQDLSESSQSSGNLSGGSHSAGQKPVRVAAPATGLPSGPQRPSSLPVCRDGHRS